MNGWKKWLLVLAFVASAALTVVFAFRAVHRRPHPKIDEQIRPWMTVSYVAHAYHLPPHVLYEALGLQHKAHDKLTIAKVAREQNRLVGAVITDLREAIDRARPPGETVSPFGPPRPGQSPSPPSHQSAPESGPPGGAR